MKRLGTGVESGHQEAEATGIMEHHRPANDAATRAFTLRELVVVIAVLSVLGGTLLAALQQRASWQIKKTQCAANLRQFALATQLYATENCDKLPEISTGAWAWDFPGYAADAFLQFGMDKRTFYCPGTAPRFNDNYNFLNSEPNSLWNFWGPELHIIGYSVAFNASPLALSNRNTTILPEPIKINANIFPAPPNHERVLLSDATISSSLSGTAANPAPAGSFTSVTGGFSVNGTHIPHLSPHLKGNLPAGGNLAFKDGHVAWRKFAQMQQRAERNWGFWW
ncbi:MAG: type II secretion system protein [Verrucomicrobiota bacterium]